LPLGAVLLSYLPAVHAALLLLPAPACSDDDAFDLDNWVLNTEAHPLKVSPPAEDAEQQGKQQQKQPQQRKPWWWPPARSKGGGIAVAAGGAGDSRSVER
jgi:Tfp pilus assembly protein PilP